MILLGHAVSIPHLLHRLGVADPLADWVTFDALTTARQEAAFWRAEAATERARADRAERGLVPAMRVEPGAAVRVARDVVAPRLAQWRGDGGGG